MSGDSVRVRTCSDDVLIAGGGQFGDPERVHRQ